MLETPGAANELVSAPNCVNNARFEGRTAAKNGQHSNRHICSGGTWVKEYQVSKTVIGFKKGMRRLLNKE